MSVPAPVLLHQQAERICCGRACRAAFGRSIRRTLADLSGSSDDFHDSLPTDCCAA